MWLHRARGAIYHRKSGIFEGHTVVSHHPYKSSCFIDIAFSSSCALILNMVRISWGLGQFPLDLVGKSVAGQFKESLDAFSEACR
jgi:hypothetical protein